MARIHANGIDIEYEEFGPKTGTPVLVIMGLGARGGASAPPSRPTTLAESDKHVAAVARTTAARAQALRNPRGVKYPDDATL